MIIDDSLICLKIISYFLVKIGYDVSIYTNALSAISVFTDQKEMCDMIIVDINMPQMV